MYVNSDIVLPGNCMGMWNVLPSNGYSFVLPLNVHIEINVHKTMRFMFKMWQKKYEQMQIPVRSESSGRL